MKHYKNIFITALCVCIALLTVPALLSALSVPVLAEGDGVTYAEGDSVTVDGVTYAEGGDVSDTGVDLTDVARATYYRAGAGYLLFTPAATDADGNAVAATLVMKHADVGRVGAFGIRFGADLTLVTEGDCSLSSGAVADGASMGLAVYGALRITGDGTLTVNAGEAQGLYRGSTAIFARNAITVEEAVTVRANAGAARFAVAVQTTDRLTVNGRLITNAMGGGADFCAAVQADALTLGENGSLVICADGDHAFYPIQTDEAVEASTRITVMKDGCSYAWGGNASALLRVSELPAVPTYYVADCENTGKGYAVLSPAENGTAVLSLYDAHIGSDTNVGIYMQGNFNAEIVYWGDCRVETADAPTDAERKIKNAAIVANGALTLVGGDSGATLTLSAGEGYSSYGIYSYDLILDGGALTATASDAVRESHGVYVRGAMSVCGGTTLYAVSGGAETSVGVTVQGSMTNAGSVTGVGASCAINVEGEVSNVGLLSDMTAPTAAVTSSDVQVPFDGAATDAFEYFFRTEKRFFVSVSDAESWVRGAEYFIGAHDLTALDGVAWQTCGDGILFSPEKAGIYRIYLRLTDTAGNTRTVCSPALVWYEDVAQGLTLQYLKYTAQNASLTLDPLGNAVASPHVSVTCVNGDGKTTVTLDGAYLETLEAGVHSLVLSLLPQGRSYAEGAINDPPSEVRLTVTVAYFAPVRGEDYAVYGLNADGWSRDDVTVRAGAGYLLSAQIDGVWSESLVTTVETACGVLEFYVKDTSNGAISRLMREHYKLDRTAPVLLGVSNGSTCYTTQVYTVTDANLETQTVTVAGNRRLSYTQSFTDPAGNTLTVSLEILPIRELSAPILGLEPLSVNSTHTGSVERVLLAVGAVDASNADASEAAELEEIAARCRSLLAVIGETQLEKTRVEDLARGYLSRNVLIRDREGLQALIADFDALLRGDNLTAEERGSLEARRGHLCDLTEISEGAALALATDALGAAGELTEQSVTPTDTALLREALGDLSAALERYGAHYTEAERAWIEAEMREYRALLSLILTPAAESAPNAVPSDTEANGADTVDPVSAAAWETWLWIPIAGVCLLIAVSVVADVLLLRQRR